MIDEKKLIEEVNRIIFEADIHKSYVQEVFKDILDTIKNQTNIGEWIPVSERLPGEAFGCLVIVMDSNSYTCEDFENILPYIVGYDGETWNDADGIIEAEKWMELNYPEHPWALVCKKVFDKNVVIRRVDKDN